MAFRAGSAEPDSRSRSVSPSSSSETAYTTASSRPKSWRARMLGCERAATARASLSKRASASASAESFWGRTLIATSRPSRVSRAR